VSIASVRFAAKRIAEALPVLFGVVVLTFLMTRALPGDPAARAKRIRLDGEPASPIDPPPTVCRFESRCRVAVPQCRREMPVLKEVGAGHAAACHLAGAALVS
jgi:oligopeptide/dipeptide ABC transporter ATP-binding protein